MSETGTIIVGAGHAGAHAAICLRSQGYKPPITIIGSEPSPPYERPPLSKDYLMGNKQAADLFIRPPEFWRDEAIKMVLGHRVISVDPVARRITLSNDETMEYASLIWAAGANPRQLPCAGARLAGVHSVRCLEDVDRMLAELHAGARKVVVIGGGYIGLEAAAVLVTMGCHVTVLEAQDRVLSRVAGVELSRFYENEHRARGIDLRTEVGEVEIEGDDTHVTGVRLADGQVVHADMVIVGVGIIPAIEPLVQAGAKSENGLLVDQCCRTSLDDIYAVGDCAAHANRYARDEFIRLESVQNAQDMGETAARAICGDPEPYDALPWFWSDQYDLKLQTAGLSNGHDETIVRGSPSERKFSVVYLSHGEIIAADCVNRPRDFMQVRKLIGANLKVDRKLVADPNVPLKRLVSQT